MQKNVSSLPSATALTLSTATLAPPTLLREWKRQALSLHPHPLLVLHATPIDLSSPPLAPVIGNIAGRDPGILEGPLGPSAQRGYPSRVRAHRGGGGGRRRLACLQRGWGGGLLPPVRRTGSFGCGLVLRR